MSQPNSHALLLAVAKLGHTMREKQRAYFMSRAREDLIASKQAESAFDMAVEIALAKVLEESFVASTSEAAMTRAEEYEETSNRG